MMTFKVTLDGKADLGRFAHNLQTNILRSQTKMATRLGKIGKGLVEFNAPEWRGTLKNRVALKVFPRNHKAEIFMSSSLFEQIALENEYNISGRRKLYKSAYPKLAEWAEDKGVFQNQPYVLVGG